MVYEESMILNCPKCSARFHVLDTAVPVQGRAVRCGQCGHEWHAHPATRAAALEAATVQADTVEHAVPPPATALVAPEALPTTEEEILARLEAATQATQQKPKRRVNDRPTRMTDAKVSRLPTNPLPFKLAAAAFAACWLVLAYFAYFPSLKSLPGFSGVYEAFGATPTDGLVFADVSMEREQEGNRARFILSGSIRNDTSVSREIPSVRVELKDKDAGVMWSREYPVKKELKPGEVYPFRISNVETNFAKNVVHIIVDMGNAMQLMVR
jgi:predicted Zn finger-like uncharacterized protein